jgi:hypothetical protein
VAKRISELPLATLANESDIDAVVQSGITRKRTLTQLRAAIVGGWQGFIGTFLDASSADDARAAIGAIGSADNITGSAGKLTTARNIAATGDVAWNVNFDGSGNATAAATVGRKVSPAYIEGLQMSWVSANALTVQTGSAYIDSLATVLAVPAAIAKTGLVLAAATKYHVYLFSNAGTPDIEIVTTAPSAKVYGNARTKTGDASRRYIGSIFTGAANTILRFKQSGNKILYGGDFTAAPFSVLSNGVATASTNVSLAGCVPETAPIAQLFLWSNTANAVGLYVNDADTGAVSTTNSQVSLALGQMLCCELAISYGAQLLSYAYSATPGANGAYIRVQGYTFER